MKEKTRTRPTIKIERYPVVHKDAHIDTQIEFYARFNYNSTGCCALVHLRGGEKTSTHEINAFCATLQEHAKLNWYGTPNTGSGATSVFAIVSPFEFAWQQNLEECGFKPIHNFKRRNGYPEDGELTMYIKNVI